MGQLLDKAQGRTSNSHVFVWRSSTMSKRPMRLKAVAQELAGLAAKHKQKPVVRTHAGYVQFDFHWEQINVYGVTADDVRQAYLDK